MGWEKYNQQNRRKNIVEGKWKKKKNCCGNLLSVLGIDESAVGKLGRKIKKIKNEKIVWKYIYHSFLKFMWKERLYRKNAVNESD